MLPRSVRSRGVLVGVVGCAWLGVVADARALSQPDGTVIPAGSGLQSLFDSRGETIDALAAASTTPETFVPSCALTFDVLQRNAGYRNAFGWYNITGQKPSNAELFEFLSCADDVGTSRVLDIKSDPRWTGGEVGFYQGVIPSGCTPGDTNAYAYVFFSQKDFNPDSNQSNPFLHLLIYDSTVTPRAFYFGWEDLISGGDNDFDDLTTFVTGITCSGGGVPCETGLPGVCGNGILQCQSGILTCIPTIAPGVEACDGFDNDCNDAIDEGDLCPGDSVCVEGNCVPKCSGGEFTCIGDTVCNADGVCVEPACLDVDCPDGTKCAGGQCVGPCDGVECPYGQTCQLGVCLDPCAPLTCDSGQVCVAGVCIEGCGCGGCPDGEVCQTDGRCVSAACDGTTCASGEHCDPATGACVSDCEGAVCPSGQFCTQGSCVVDPNGQGGSGGGTGSGFASSSSASTAASGPGGAGGAESAASSGSGGAGGAGADSSGCSCNAAGSTEERSLLGGLGLGMLGLALARRRARRSGSSMRGAQPSTSTSRISK
jgi:hypothetical protein